MPSEIETLLARAKAELPKPEPAAVERAVRVVVASLAAAPPRHRRRVTVARWALVTGVLLSVGFGAGVAWGPQRTQAAEAAVSAPGFLPAEGWNTLQTAPPSELAEPTAPSALAATVPFAPQDVELGAANLPSTTIASLGQHAIMIQAVFYVPPQTSDSSSFPSRDLPLSLEDATSSSLEGVPSNRPSLALTAKVRGWWVDVHVFFGGEPTPEMRQAADDELTRLLVPSDEDGKQ